MKLGLTPEQIAERHKGIGGSDAGKIMAGEWYQLWAEKTGVAKPEDLSRVLPVQLGSFTESFNAFWFTQETGRAVSNRGELVVSKKYPFMRCNLDGLTTADDLRAIWQAKHVSGREPVEVVTQRYTPQVTHEMLVLGVERAVLSLLIGTDKFVAVDLVLDEFYASQLVDQERKFWHHVETKTPPPDAPVIAAPVAIKEMRKLDLSADNMFVALASDWLANKAAAATFKAAEAGLKAKVPDDVSEARGGGIVVKRDGRGLKIGAEK